MTAEILIMNREVAVLAADSAATMDQRTFNTDKIFRLTENQPIGLMIYNKPDLLGVPIAQIAKTFRRQNNDRDFQSIGDCVKAFLEFIKTEVIEKADAGAFEIEASGFLDETLTMILSQHETVKQFGFLPSAEQTFIGLANSRDTFFDELIQLISTLLENNKDDEADASRSNRAFLNHVNNAFDSFVTNVNKKIKAKIPPELITKLRALVKVFIDKKISSNRHTGIVFCGYGEADTFPCFKEIIIDGLSEKGMRHWEKNHVKISYDNNAVIMPFAQTKAISPILLGTDDDTLIQAVNYFANFSEFIIAEYGISFDSDKVVDDYEWFLISLRHEFLSPYIEGISIMPKEELAIIAEALIDLCSMTRKMENMVRSVGGQPM